MGVDCGLGCAHGQGNSRRLRRSKGSADTGHPKRARTRAIARLRPLHNKAAGTIRRAWRAAVRSTVLASAADVTLVQLGAPGAFGCFTYLVRRWTTGLRRSTSGVNTSIHPGQAVPASGTDVLDPERS